MNAITFAVTRHDTPDGHTYTDAQGVTVPGITTILGTVLGRPPIPAWYAESGTICHAMIRRSLCGMRNEMPPEGDHIATDAWQHYVAWEAWRVRMLQAGQPPYFPPATLESAHGCAINGLRYAFTVDAVGFIGNDPVIVDWKRSLPTTNALRHKYTLQLTGIFLGLGSPDADLLVVGGDPCGTAYIDPDLAGLIEILERYWEHRT